MSKLTQEEEEYLEELKLCLEEDGEITPPARRLLDKIRDKAGITPERALQLEKMMEPSEETSPITDVEAEYMQEFRTCIEEDGEITASSRRLLDRLAKKSGIDESRAKELKAMVTSEVSSTDEGSGHNPDSAHLPAEQFHHTTDILKHIKGLLPDLRLHSPDDLTYCYIPEEIPERQFINFNKHAADRLAEGEILLIYYDEALFDRLSGDKSERETERKPVMSETSAGSEEKTEVLKGKFGFASLKKKVKAVGSMVAESASTFIDKVGELAGSGQIDFALLTNKRMIVKKLMRDPISIFFADRFEVGFEYETEENDKKVTRFERDLSRADEVGKVTFVIKREDEKHEIYFSKNSRTVARFLQSIKANRMEERIDGLSTNLSWRYCGHHIKTMKDYPESIKGSYLKIITPIINADGEVDPSESTELYNQFLELSCTRDTRLEIMEALSTTTPIESYFPRLKENIALLTEKERRNIIYALYFNLTSMAKVDGYMLDDAERAMLASYCSEFGISDEEADNIHTIAENTIRLVRGEITEDAFKKATKNSIATASGLGVPVAALFFMGTVGFSGAGIMSGLAAIGGVLAFIPGLNAATLGIVGLVGIGTLTYKGIEYATGIKEREQKKKREMLLQKAMENHQKCISTLQSDMNHLTERLQSASKDTHQNAALIEKLNRQMALFKQTMMESRKRGEKIKLESEALSAS